MKYEKEEKIPAGDDICSILFYTHTSLAKAINISHLFARFSFENLFEKKKKKGRL